MTDSSIFGDFLFEVGQIGKTNPFGDWSLKKPFQPQMNAKAILVILVLREGVWRNEPILGREDGPQMDAYVRGRLGWSDSYGDFL